MLLATHEKYTTYSSWIVKCATLLKAKDKKDSKTNYT
jgi:hypothetical protein